VWGSESLVGVFASHPGHFARAPAPVAMRLGMHVATLLCEPLLGGVAGYSERLTTSRTLANSFGNSRSSRAVSFSTRSML
jgi:hypothetical protein